LGQVSGPTLDSIISPHSSVHCHGPDVQENAVQPKVMRSTCSNHKVSPVVVSTIPLTSVSTSSVLNRTIKGSPCVMFDDSSSTSIISHDLTKKVEQEIIQFFSPTTFVLVFESFPYWILALHPSFVEGLYFPQFTSIVSLRNNLESSAKGKIFYTLLSEVFDSSKFYFSSSLSSEHVVLITGSISFANHQICLHVPSDIPWLLIQSQGPAALLPVPLPLSYIGLATRCLEDLPLLRFPSRLHTQHFFRHQQLVCGEQSEISFNTPFDLFQLLYCAQRPALITCLCFRCPSCLALFSFLLTILALGSVNVFLLQTNSLSSSVCLRISDLLWMWIFTPSHQFES